MVPLVNDEGNGLHISEGTRTSTNVDHLILDADGCLHEEERKQHCERNLCLYCGDATHMVNQCPKIPSDCHTAGGSTAVGQATFVISPSEEPFVDLSTALLESAENDSEVQP